jgi:glutamate-ammonia-ligase adenylyltransferase
MEVAIEQLVDAGHLSSPLIAAREALARLLVAARLIAPDGELPPPAARQVLAKACLCGDWDAVSAGVLSASHAVAAAWAEVFGETLEVT